MCVREFEVKDMYEELKEIIDKSKRIVFFGGAGVSTESGVPDFRSENGLYQPAKLRPLAGRAALLQFFSDMNTFDYYKNNLIYRDVKPNRAHLALAELEKRKLLAAVTQNIDGSINWREVKRFGNCTVQYSAITA